MKDKNIVKDIVMVRRKCRHCGKFNKYELTKVKFDKSAIIEILGMLRESVVGILEKVGGVSKPQVMDPSTAHYICHECNFYSVAINSKGERVCVNADCEIYLKPGM